ncbi:hypothetical protein V5P93_003352 [Actinokineospora auranticolor]|uniref:hypothetical protein n=1 Tax=Actinokineospora auranticolor TaxID=155976 RepID=UPI0011B06CC1|nr:hypothetical protein [Actinokineospora auranticolor]
MRVAVVVLGVLSVAACDDPQVVVPQRVVATVCDVVTGDLVARLTGSAAGAPVDGGCTSDPGAGITARQSWTVDGVTLTAYATGRAFDVDVPDDRRCSAVVGARERACFVTDDAAVVGLDGFSLVTSVGDGAPESDEATSDEPAAGPYLVDYATAVAEALVTAAPTATPKAPTPKSAPTRSTTSAPSVPARKPLHTAKCVLYLGSGAECGSVDPVVEVRFNSSSLDSSACGFAGTLDFGDGTTQDWEITGRLGLIPMATHTYEKPGTYRLSTTARTSHGPCGAYGGTYSFTYESPPTPATCEYKFDPDRGRTYLYTMLPQGALKNGDGAVETSFKYSLLGNNTYVDEAGVRWTLMSDFASKEHQPLGWGYLSGAAPFRKFVSDEDSRGGSFEAVLMPDGIQPDTPFRGIDGRALTYAKSNWLVVGRGMPTYNITHPSGPVGNFNHLVDDWYPHVFKTPSEFGDRKDDRYVAPTHMVDPKHWLDYREKVEGLQKDFAGGYRYDAATGSLAKGTSTKDVPDYLRWVAEDLQGCAK